MNHLHQIVTMSDQFYLEFIDAQKKLVNELYHRHTKAPMSFRHLGGGRQILALGHGSFVAGPDPKTQAEWLKAQAKLDEYLRIRNPAQWIKGSITKTDQCFHFKPLNHDLWIVHHGINLDGIETPWMAIQKIQQELQ